jgi:hypothetical protein
LIRILAKRVVFVRSCIERWATGGGNGDTAEWVDVVRLLMEAGADPNEVCIETQPATLCLARARSGLPVSCPVSQVATVAVPGRFCERSLPHILDSLLSARCFTDSPVLFQVDTVTGSEQTALHKASSAGKHAQHAARRVVCHSVLLRRGLFGP